MLTPILPNPKPFLGNEPDYYYVESSPEHESSTNQERDIANFVLARRIRTDRAPSDSFPSIVIVYVTPTGTHLCSSNIAIHRYLSASQCDNIRQDYKTQAMAANNPAMKPVASVGPSLSAAPV